MMMMMMIIMITMIKRIYKDCKVTQKKVVFDFLGGYTTLLEQEIHSLTVNHKRHDIL